MIEHVADNLRFIVILKVNFSLVVITFLVYDNTQLSSSVVLSYYMALENEARQFGGKTNSFDLPSLALKRQEKSFVMPLRQLKRQLQLFS